MNDRKWTILYPSVSMPVEYLSAIESFMCGTRYQLHFSSKPSCAMALTREEAQALLKVAMDPQTAVRAGIEYPEPELHLAERREPSSASCEGACGSDGGGGRRKWVKRDSVPSVAAIV